jgi:hypothetical protein
MRRVWTIRDGELAEEWLIVRHQSYNQKLWIARTSKAVYPWGN